MPKATKDKSKVPFVQELERLAKATDSGYRIEPVTIDVYWEYFGDLSAAFWKRICKEATLTQDRFPSVKKLREIRDYLDPPQYKIDQEKDVAFRAEEIRQGSIMQRLRALPAQEIDDIEAAACTEILSAHPAMAAYPKIVGFMAVHRMCEIYENRYGKVKLKEEDDVE